MAPAALDLVRRSPELLAAHGTGRLWFQMLTFDGEDDWFDLRDDPTGSLEFAGGRFAIGGEAAGEGGRYFSRLPGEEEWHVRGEPDGPLDALSPFWVIELVRGAASAEELPAGDEAADGLTRYSCAFDLVAAEEASAYRLRAPGSMSVGDWRALPGEAWLDSDGCLRRAACQMPGAEIDLRLDDLGAPGSVELPADAKPFLS